MRAVNGDLSPERRAGRPRKGAARPKLEASPAPAPPDGEVQRGFAERLRRAFDASGLTHGEFAKRSGLPYGALSVILKRAADPTRMGPSIVTVEAIARGLGVRPGWLAFGEGEGLVDAEKHLACDVGR